MRKVYPKKDNRVLNSNGQEVTAPNAFLYFDDLLHQQASIKHVALQGQITIFDLKITEEIKLSGGEVWVMDSSQANVGDEDYVEFSIVDKDDVFGLFAVLGLTPGVDVLEVTKFVYHEYLKKGNSYYSDLASNVPGSASVMQGLYRREVFHSINSTGDIEFISKLYYYIPKS